MHVTETKMTCDVHGTSSNGVARTLKKYVRQRETTVSSIDSLQLRPFSKGNFSYRKEFLQEEADSFL